MTVQYDSEGRPYQSVSDNPDLAKFDLDGDGYVTQSDIVASENVLKTTAESNANGSLIRDAAMKAGVKQLGSPTTMGFGMISTILSGLAGKADGDTQAQQQEFHTQLVNLLKAPEGATQPASTTQPAADSITGNQTYDSVVSNVKENEASGGSTVKKNPLIGLDSLYDNDLIASEVDENGKEVFYIATGKKDGKRIARYRKGDEYNSVQSMKPKALTALRQQAYYAGYYGEDGPSSFVGPATMEDVELMEAVMSDANVSGLEWTDLMSQRAAVGQRYGRPVTSGEVAKLAGDAAGALNEFAAANGLKLSDKFIRTQAERVADGASSVDDVINYMKESYLKTAYPAFNDEIDKGFSLSDIAQPYIDTVANVLELDDVDINDPAVRKALQAKGPDGKPVRKSLWEFEEDIKKDPRWQYTNNAWQSVGSASMEVMRMMGMEG